MKYTFSATVDFVEVLFKFSQWANKVCWLEYDLIVNVVTTRHSFHNSIQITFYGHLCMLLLSAEVSSNEIPLLQRTRAVAQTNVVSLNLL